MSELLKSQLNIFFNVVKFFTASGSCETAQMMQVEINLGTCTIQNCCQRQIDWFHCQGGQTCWLFATAHCNRKTQVNQSKCTASYVTVKALDPSLSAAPGSTINRSQSLSAYLLVLSGKCLEENNVRGTFCAFSIAFVSQSCNFECAGSTRSVRQFFNTSSFATSSQSARQCFMIHYEWNWMKYSQSKESNDGQLSSVPRATKQSTVQCETKRKKCWRNFKRKKVFVVLN